MVTHDTFEAMQEIIETVGDSVGLKTQEYEELAEEAFGYLANPADGHLLTVGAPEPSVSTALNDELADWDEDNLPCSYGLDASTTQEQSFTNGMKIAIANAKIGVTGDGLNKLEDKNHVVTVLYDPQDESGLTSQTYRETDTVTAKLETFDETLCDEAVNIVKIQNMARVFSEGRVFNSLATEIDDGIIFLDGPLYPPLTLPVVRKQYHATDVEDAWENVLGGIVRNYIQGISKRLDSGYPVIGVVKSVDSAQLVNAAKRKMENIGHDVSLPWSSDGRFMTDLLPMEDIDTYAYTSWFEEKRVYTNRQPVHPLKGAPNCPNPDDFNRAFFYVYVSDTETIMRVETPAGFIRDAHSRELIQKRALKEIARVGDIPEATLRADSNARISRENARKLFNKLHGKMNSENSYNEDHRGPNYTGSN